MVGCQRDECGEFDPGVAHRLIEVRGLGPDGHAHAFEPRAGDPHRRPTRFDRFGFDGVQNDRIPGTRDTVRGTFRAAQVHGQPDPGGGEETERPRHRWDILGDGERGTGLRDHTHGPQHPGEFRTAVEHLRAVEFDRHGQGLDEPGVGDFTTVDERFLRCGTGEDDVVGLPHGDREVEDLVDGVEGAGMRLRRNGEEVEVSQRRPSPRRRGR